MAEILSFSLPEKDVNKIEKLQKELNLSGRSELLRLGLDLIEQEKATIMNLKGIQDAIIVVIHKHHTSDELHNITKSYTKIIKSQIHSELKDDKCMDFLLLAGEAENIRELYIKILSNKKLEKVRLMSL